MSKEDTFNCNSKRLCGAIKSLMSLSTMDSAMWVMARENPVEFVEFVETHIIEIQAEFEGHFKVSAVYPRFLRQNPKLDHNNAPYTNRIGAIKLVREMSCVKGIGNDWGLADAKNFVERIPQDFRMFYFTSVSEAQSSSFMRECLALNIEIEWVATDSIDGLIHYNDHPRKNNY